MKMKVRMTLKPYSLVLSTKNELLERINNTAELLKKHLDSDDPQLVSGIEKFLVRFNDISLISISRLATALHNFGAKIKVGASLTSGQIRRGKRIGVQAPASGRRKYSSRGKAPMIAGRPRSSYIKKTMIKAVDVRYALPVRKRKKTLKKRPHNLAVNTKLGRQNAGKW